MNGIAKGAVFLPALLAGVAALASPAPAADGPAARTNPFNEQLRHLDTTNKMAAIRRAVTTSGESCGRVTDVRDDGPYHNLGRWSVRCMKPDGEYALFVGPDRSIQVRKCADEAGLKLPACTLPRASKPKAMPYAKPR